jgi:hypothetical protein
MLQHHTTTPDHVAWAKRVNSRWIVHHDLNRNAESYLDHLARTDQARLVSSCRNAHLMTGWCDAMEDPKPWFYSGLFSLTTPEEAENFLADHWLTRMVTAPPGELAVTSPENVAETTFEKIQRIQMALTKLPPPS